MQMGWGLAAPSKKKPLKIYIQPIYLVLERRANQSVHCVASYPDMKDILWTK